MLDCSYIIDIVLNVSGICGGPSRVGRGRQVMWGILPEGLFASRNTGAWVVQSWCRRGIMGIPQ